MSRLPSKRFKNREKIHSKRGRKLKTWKGKEALIENLEKTTKRGARSLENLERREK
jgi:hypothetical protein